MMVSLAAGPALPQCLGRRGYTIAGRASGIRLCFACGLIFLVLRQTMPMASGLAGGIALSTHHAFSHSSAWVGRQIANPRLRTIH